MGINFWGVVHGTKAFLPHLKAAGEGHVVNISSIFGLHGIPTQSAYNAAKFAVRGFTEALRMELDIERCGVSATSVHPGGIKTNIAKNARLGGAPGEDVDLEAARRDFEKLFITSPEKAAAQIALTLAESYRDDDELSDVRVGLASGPVLQREADLFGPVVNRARRIVNLAFPGTVVCSEEIHAALADDGK